MEEKSLPLVSVIVPCYNHEKYVKETIESIINQTYKNIELIVIDDGSKDDSVQVIQKLADKFRFTFVHRPNKGLSATLNEGIKLSKGKYFSAIASDDICTLDKIEILVNQFEKLDDEYGLVCGNAQFIDENSNIFDLNDCNNLMQYFTQDKNDFDMITQFGTYKSLLNGNYIPVMSTLIKKSALMEIGLYEEDISLEDWNMWFKLSKKYKMKFVDKSVAFYRWHDSNSTKTISKRLAMDLIFIFEREKEYAFSMGLKRDWRRGYFSSLSFLVKNKNLALFWQKIIKNNFFSYSLFLVNKFYIKILKK